MKISEVEWKPHSAGMGGEHATAKFGNGYTASIIRGGCFYTSDGTYEIAVMHSDHLCYDTPITDDVLGYLSEDDANKALADIEALPIRDAKAA